MTKFRWHRGSLIDSMNTVVEIADVSELTALIEREWSISGVPSISIEHYTYDARIGWDTYLVRVLQPDGNWAVAGMTDGPLL